MKNTIPLILILSILIFALIKQYIDKSSHTKHKTSTSLRNNSAKIKSKLAQLNTTQYIKNYIIDVINNGSRGLNFKGGIMEAGFASKEDAPKIACYVLTFSGRKCKDENISDAPMFYSSICAGCHGMDGKGIHGTYPDLTRPKLLGIQKREEELLSLP